LGGHRPFRRGAADGDDGSARIGYRDRGNENPAPAIKLENGARGM